MNRQSYLTITVLALVIATRGFAQSNTSPWPSSGNVGIGTTSPGESKLKVQHSISDPPHLESTNIEQLYSISSTDTDYIKALDIEKYWYDVPSGVTANGYQIGLASQVFVSDTNFRGTIDSQFGIWSRTGINVAGASGARTVNNAYGIYLEGLTGAGTVLNHYGVFQSGAGTKNYFGGNVGIGTTAPGHLLDVNGPIAVGGQAALYSDSSFIHVGDIMGGDGYRGLVFRTNDGERMRIDSNGNVGIGATSLSVALTVGNGRVAQLGESDGGGGAFYFRRGYSGGNPSVPGVTGAIFYHHDGGTSGNNEAMKFIGEEFRFRQGTTSDDLFTIKTSGNVGIGTTNPTQKLAVNGTIRAKEVIVEASPWPDDVFEEGYRLKALSEVAAHIEAEGHLPGVPSAATVAEKGVAVGEMQAVLLRKIEEVTLHLIAQEKAMQTLTRENAELRAELEMLKHAVNH